jgi:hypothetical protein
VKISVYVRFPCNASGVRVAVVRTEAEALRVARRYGYAITFWKETR